MDCDCGGTDGHVTEPPRAREAAARPAPGWDMAGGCWDVPPGGMVPGCLGSSWAMFEIPVNL